MMKNHLTKPTLRSIIYITLLLILTSLLLLLTGISLAQEGEDPPVPRSDDPEAFPIVPVEPSQNTNQVESITVLIIQDQLPWGYDSIQHILARHGVSYQVINSSQIAAANLAPYPMIIVPSVQTNAFYTNWNANIAKIESYVNNGGKLWLSTCNYSGHTEPVTPGGVVSTSDSDSFNVVVDPVHRWMWGAPDTIYGGDASHDSLTNLYPGSKVLAKTQNSGNAVVVDYPYGAGQVMLSGMTLEFAYAANWNAKPILVNSLVRMLGLNPIRALIIQDDYPWVSNAIQSTLDAMGVRYDTVSSSSMASVDLRPYDVVIIPSVQTNGYYNAWNSNFSRFQSFVSAGSKLWLSAANQSGQPEPQLPGGVNSADDYDSYNLVVQPGHPWARGVPTRMWGNWANHQSFSNLLVNSTIVMKAETSGKPTLVDYPYGFGRVMINGITLEIAWALDWDGKPIVKNTLQDLLGIPYMINIPSLMNNYCPDFGDYEIEDNNTFSTANGPLCLGKSYLGNPDNNSGGPSAEDRDWFKFYWDGTGTLKVDVTNYLADAQVLLYFESDPGSYLVRDFLKADGHYVLNYSGKKPAGTYYVQLYAPPGHPTGNGDYTIKVSDN